MSGVERPNVTGIDHIRLYVSNICQAAHFYRSVLGFRTNGAPAIATLPSESESSLLAQRDGIRLVLTGPLTASSPVAEHIRVHGEGVKDIALAVTALDDLFERAIQSGATPVERPSTQHTAGGTCRIARIGVFGDVVHTFISRLDSTEPASAAHADDSNGRYARDTALGGIDHVAFALETGELDKWVGFYVEGLGFTEAHQEYVSTEYSAMRSKVVQSPEGNVKFPMMEPATGKRESQIERYLRCHAGPGAQHLAFRSNDIIKSVAAMRNCGLEFLLIPDTYYEALRSRIGDGLEIEELKKHSVLADHDDTGTLLQIFTKPIGTRSTLFLEIIERRGAQGFGSGNIRSLFEAVERAQAKSPGHESPNLKLAAHASNSGKD